MKITIISTLLITFISILGMFYWMWKAKSGELLLNSNSWHIKLKTWMWDYQITGRENACPYYWGLVFSIIILPLYSLSKYFFKITDFIGDKIKYVFKKLFGNIKKPKLNINIHIPLPKLPETKREIYTEIYQNGKYWLIFGFIVLVFLFLTISIIAFIIKSYNINSYFGTIVLSMILLAISVVLQHTFKEEWDEYYYDHFYNLFKSIVGLIQLPFIILYHIFAYPIKKIFKIYEDNCPPIKWIN